jgi:hypothetical protein
MGLSSHTSTKYHPPGDRVLPETRIILGLLIPFLVLAFLILYLVPGETAQRFSWEIKPAVTAALMGSGYLGGAYLFLQAVLKPAWHRVASGLPPVFVFATSMLLITILHWERFDLNHFPFQLWLVLYIAAPILVPILYLRNRSQDLTAPTGAERIVPAGIRISLALVAVVLAAFAVVGFISPEILIRTWPWTLTALTARVICGWLLLLAAGGLTLARELRWSAWRVPLESMILWFVLFLVGAFIHRADMLDGVFLNWFVIMFMLGVAGMLWVYFYMTALVRQPLPTAS